jgi:hypothetical protein
MQTAADTVLSPQRRGEVLTYLNTLKEGPLITAARGYALCKLLELEVGSAMCQAHWVKVYKFAVRLGVVLEEVYGRRLEWVKNRLRAAAAVVSILAISGEGGGGEEAVASCGHTLTHKLVAEMMTEVQIVCGLGSKEHWTGYDISVTDFRLLVSEYVAPDIAIQLLKKCK